jgi:hypothetical protein
MTCLLLSDEALSLQLKMYLSLLPAGGYYLILNFPQRQSARDITAQYHPGRDAVHNHGINYSLGALELLQSGVLNIQNICLRVRL